VAKFEWQVDTADGLDGTPISERVSVVGISQKAIGTLSFGQDSSPYKASGVALDPFVATTLEARNNYGMSGNRDNWSVMNGHNSFVQDGMFFNSASWAGVYVNAYLGLERTGTDGACASGTGGFIYFGNCNASTSKSNGDLNAVVGWKGNAGPVALNVFGGYAKMANTTNADEPTAMKLAGQLTVAKAHTISLQYEMTDRADRAADDYDEGTYLFLGYQGKFGPVVAVAQLGQFESGTEAGIGGRNISAQYLALGAIYKMSKTFRLFGGWRNTVVTVDPAAVDFRDDSAISLGMRKDF
jgi:predicted porin